MRQLPNHIAIIMDGNGRWAKAQNYQRMIGHVLGVTVLKNTVIYLSNLGIKYLSAFAFSKENQSRPKEEVLHLMELIYSKLELELPELHKNSIKIKFIGDMVGISSKLLSAFAGAESLTEKNTGLALNIYFNYSGQYEIINAVNNIILTNIKDITIDSFATHLLSNFPDPDLLIRTGGEQRLSNFMLWQMSYTEFYFIKCHWPEFNDKIMDEILNWYRLRDRRYGNV